MAKPKTTPASPSLSHSRRDISPIKGEKNIVILAIETSCDETAAAVLTMEKGKQIPEVATLSSVVKSQIKLHSKMGGVVPEAAARAHVKNITPVVKKALTDSGLPLGQIDYIAVTAGPGLIPSLIVGVEFAKTLALATGKPIIPVNHMAGHLYSPFGESNPKSQILNSKQNRKSIFPMISLIVSGGHTILTLMKDAKNYKVLGQTVDDAAGEAFDKVAKLLGLPYPGGPEVSKLAAQGDPNAINFPRPMISQKNYNFSFAGLKTAVLYYLSAKGQGLKAKNLDLKRLPLTAANYRQKADICASFQQAVIDVLVAKTIRAVQEFGAKSVSLSGGVAANRALREALSVKCKTLNVSLFVPPINLCTDNAEMIGLAAAFMLNRGFQPVPYAKVKADPNLSL